MQIELSKLSNIIAQDLCIVIVL